jgi:hypothetical protein
MTRKYTWMIDYFALVMTLSSTIGLCIIFITLEEGCSWFKIEGEILSIGIFLTLLLYEVIYFSFFNTNFILSQYVIPTFYTIVEVTFIIFNFSS